MAERIKVVWLTQFSNKEIRNLLPLRPSLVQRIYYKMRGLHSAPPMDRFPWNTNMLVQAEKLTDYLDLYVVCPYRDLSKHRVSFQIRGINYIFIKDEASVSLKNSLKRRFHKDEFPVYRKNWKRLEKEIDRIHTEIVHLIGAENVNYSPTIISLSKKYTTIVQLQTLMIDPEFPARYPISKEAYEYRVGWEARVLQSVHYVGTHSEPFREIIRTRIDENKKFLNIEMPEGEMADRNTNHNKVYDFEYHAFDIEKAAMDVIESFAIAHRKHPEITLDVIGGYSPHFKEQLDDRICKLGIKESVVFEGRFETIDEVKNQVKKSRFSIIPLRIDYISSSIIESMAFGNPVVSTITPGTPTLNKSRQSVLLSEVDDVQGMADNMCHLIEDEAFAETIRENAFQTIEEMYDHYNIMRKWVDAYNQIGGRL